MIKFGKWIAKASEINRSAFRSAVDPITDRHFQNQDQL